jgi:hypothetical protein
MSLITSKSSLNPILADTQPTSTNTLADAPLTEQLIDVLDQLAAVLESDGDIHWSQWIRKARVYVMNSDFYGIEYLLSAYGGMGSFNDLILGQSSVNGAFAWKPGHVELNDKFDALRYQAAKLAREIKHSQS